jgi:hypothetical protein
MRAAALRSTGLAGKETREEAEMLRKQLARIATSMLVLVVAGSSLHALYFTGFAFGISDDESTTIFYELDGFTSAKGMFHVTFTWEKPPGTVVHTESTPTFDDGLPVGLSGTLEIPVAARPGGEDVLTATVHYEIGKPHKHMQPGRWSSGLVQTTRVPTAAVFADLGQALPGPDGAPDLVGLGVFASNEPVSLRVMNGRPLASAALVIGGFAANLPHAGGTLVPWPDVVVTGLVLDAEGCLTLDSTVPEGVQPNQAVVVQCWISDDGNPAGYTATNAVTATAP